MSLRRFLLFEALLLGLLASLFVHVSSIIQYNSYLHQENIALPYVCTLSRNYSVFLYFIFIALCFLARKQKKYALVSIVGVKAFAFFLIVFSLFIWQLPDIKI